MGQSLYINFDAENLLSARVRGATDLRSQNFTQFVAGDSLSLDLFLVGSSGALNIQDYAEVRLGMGGLDSRPESGSYVVAGTDTLSYDHTAAELEAVVDAQVAGATVTKLTDFVFKVQFDAVGTQTIPSLDFINLQPRSTVSVTRLTTGDATTKESWLWRLYRNPVAFTNTFTNIAGDGIRGTLSLATAGIYDLLAQNEDVRTFFEVELTDTDGNVQTVLQAKVKLNGEVIGHNFSGSIPTSPTNSPEANAFLESFPDPTIFGNLTVDGGVTAPNIPHNTDSVIICNQGDNIQTKYDEVAALLPNGSPISSSNRATLLVMAGTYGDLDMFDASLDVNISITGLGEVKILTIDGGTNVGHGGNFRNFSCGTFTMYSNSGLIENIKCGNFNMVSNFKDIKNVTVTFDAIIGETFGIMKDVTCVVGKLSSGDNEGIIDNCHSNGTGIGLGGDIGDVNQGTIINCTATGLDSFGTQAATGVTENCIGGNRAFAAFSNRVPYVLGTYRNCKGGDNSFFGLNTDTSAVRTIEATYIDCTAGNNSFGFTNTVGAETQFAGYALDCKSGNKGFAAAGTNGGTSKIIDGAIIENCVAGMASFGTFNAAFGAFNEGAVLRCRTTETGATPFSATGTGVVRLCLKGNFDEVNLG